MKQAPPLRSPWLVAAGLLCLSCLALPNESLANAKEDAKQLRKAVKEGNLGQVEALLDDGVDADAKSDGKNKTPLMLAIKQGQTAIAKLLVERGADVDRVCLKGFFHNGWRPLHFAVSMGNTDVTNLLLENGAEIDPRNDGEVTPLIMAAGAGNTAMVRLLLERGAYIDAANPHGATPLGLAAYNGHEEMASVLVSAGANLDSRISADETLLDRGWTPLISAEIRGHLGIAKMLIENGADVNLGDLDGRSPLHIAMTLDLAELTELLIEAGSVVSAVEETGTDLFVTAQSYRLVAEHLEEAGNRERAMEHYALAAEYFEKASPALMEQSGDYRKQKKKAIRDKWLGVAFSFSDAVDASRAQKGWKELEEECVERSQSSLALAEECREKAAHLNGEA